MKKLILLVLLFAWTSVAYANNCTTGQPCGNSCISWSYTCHIGTTSVFTKASQTISFGIAPTIVIGGIGTVSATATSYLPVTYSSNTAGICIVSGSTITGIAAGTCTIAANQAGNANYNAATQVTQSITVSNVVASQAISFGSAPTVVIGGIGTVSAAATSGLPVTYSSSTAGVCTVSGSTVTGIAAGICTIAANQTGNTGYSAATQVTQSITVSNGAASQTISFGSAPTVVIGGTGTVSAAATSGLPVTYSSSTAGVCTVSGSTVTGITVGICIIAANQTGNTGYSAATQVTQNITIGNATSQTISFGSIPTVVIGGTGTVYAAATSGLPVTYSSLTSSVCTAFGSLVRGITAGICTIAANQTGNTGYAAAPQATQNITIGATVAATISDARVFAFAEANYPSLFAPSLFAGMPTTSQTTYQNVIYNYRYYQASGNYLAIDTTGVIYLFGTYTGGVLTSVGPVESFRTPITTWEVSVGLVY